MAGAALVVGLAAAGPMAALAVFGVRIGGQCDFTCTAIALFRLPAVAAALLAAGALLGLAVRRVAGRGSWGATGLVGAISFYAATHAAALATDQLGMPMDAFLYGVLFGGPYPRWLVVAATFGTCAAGAAALVTVALAFMVGARAPLGRALIVGAVTFGTYVIVGWVLDGVPGWTMDQGNRSMPKVTTMCGLIAGTAGAATLLLLLRTTDPGRSAPIDEAAE